MRLQELTTHCCMAPLSVVRLLQMSAAVWDSPAKVAAIQQQQKILKTKSKMNIHSQVLFLSGYD